MSWERTVTRTRSPSTGVRYARRSPRTEASRSTRRVMPSSSHSGRRQARPPQPSPRTMRSRRDRSGCAWVSTQAPRPSPRRGHVGVDATEEPASARWRTAARSCSRPPPLHSSRERCSWISASTGSRTSTERLTSSNSVRASFLRCARPEASSCPVRRRASWAASASSTTPSHSGSSAHPAS